MTVHAETASCRSQVGAAFDAIRKTRNLKANLTALGPEVEARHLGNVLQAVKAVHQAAKSAVARRAISAVRIDERLANIQMLENKVKSVRRKLKK